MATTTTTTTEDTILSGDEKKFSHSEERKRIRLEIIETETNYCECLELLQGMYVKRLQTEKKNAEKYHLEDKTFDILIMNLPTMVPTNLQFLEELKATDPIEVGSVMSKYAEFFRMYTSYTNAFEICLSTINQLKKDNQKFRPVLEDIDKQLQTVGPKVTLMSYLIMPVQRIPRYKLLLKSLMKASSPGHPKYKDIEKAHTTFSEIAAYINKAKGESDNRKKLMEIHNTLKSVPSNLQLIKSHRKLIKEGQLTVWMEKGLKQKSSLKIQPRQCYLFNDMLLVCKADGAVYKGCLNLASARVEMENEENFIVETSKSAFGFRESDQTKREAWIAAINECVQSAKKIRDAKRKIRGNNKRSLNSPKGKDSSVHDLISFALKDVNTKPGPPSIAEKPDS